MYFHLLGVAGRDGLVCIKQQAQLTGIMAVGEAAVLSCKWGMAPGRALGSEEFWLKVCSQRHPGVMQVGETWPMGRLSGGQQHSTSY